MDLLRRHEKKNHASLAAQQEAIPTRPEQIGSSTQLAPSNVTNATEDDVYAEASYMLMPAQVGLPRYFFMWSMKTDTDQ